MGNNHDKYLRTDSGSVQSFGCGKAVYTENASESHPQWLDIGGSVSSRLSVFSERLASVASRAASFSWRSGHSASLNRRLSASNVPPRRGRQWRSGSSCGGGGYSRAGSSSCHIKTVWPVSLCEALFLPAFPVRDRLFERQFQVVCVLGSGSFGKVFHVEQRHNGETFALKVLSKSQVVRECAVGQVKDEVGIQAACGHHRFIVGCRQRWQTRKQLFVLEEYVCGGDMHSLWLKHSGGLCESLVKIFVAQLIVALDFLHNAGVIYRDLKLENVLLDANMNVQLTDFGLAKWLRRGSRTNTVCGTVSYMAPEVLDLQPYTHAADWWCLGVLTHCLLTGQFPFDNQMSPLVAQAAVSAVSEDQESSANHKNKNNNNNNTSVGAGDDGGAPQLCRHLRRMSVSSAAPLLSHVSAAGRKLVAGLLTADAQTRLNTRLKLQRQPWFLSVNLDHVAAGAHTCARTVYQHQYPPDSHTSHRSHSSVQSDTICPSSHAVVSDEDFIDFDAGVDESGDNHQLLEEFPRLSPLPTTLASAGEGCQRPSASHSFLASSTPMRATPGGQRANYNDNCSAPVEQESQAASPQPRQTETSSGDILELCLPHVANAAFSVDTPEFVHNEEDDNMTAAKLTASEPAEHQLNTNCRLSPALYIPANTGATCADAGATTAGEWPAIVQALSNMSSTGRSSPII